MPFYRFDLGAGRTSWAHVNFGRKPGAALCVAPRLATDQPLENDGGRCCRMSVALCDAPAGHDLGGKPLTCSAPMCDGHRQRVGPNEDRCPRHRLKLETQETLGL